MGFETAGYQLQPVLPELVLAVGAMVLLMLGAYRGQDTTRLVNALAVCLLVLTGVLELLLPGGKLPPRKHHAEWDITCRPLPVPNPTAQTAAPASGSAAASVR